MKSLYDQIGGAPTVAAVVDELYERLTTDPIVMHHFTADRLPSLKSQQHRWFRSVLGGAGESDRPDLADAHRHVVITSEDVTTVLGHLESSLAASGVDDQLRHKVMALVSRLWHARSF